jgi:hypothetical protein
MDMERNEHALNEKFIKKMVGKPKAKIPLGRPRSKWQDNIRMNLRETAWESVDWIHLSQDRDQ